ncbi:MAG: hypothetical protein Q4C22_04045 [Bacillota bacterium]|nr:hypothetical protein [Bacillota bacterium]
MWTFFSFACLIGFTVAIPVVLYRDIKKFFIQLWRADAAEAATIKFIDEHQLMDVPVGFYDFREKILAEQIDVHHNTAYQLLSIKLNELHGNISERKARKVFREVMRKEK